MLVALRITALENRFIPAELQMGRRLRTLISTMNDKLKPKVLDEKSLFKKKQENVI